MEAMAAGRPVLTTRIAGVPELVEDGVSGRLVPPGNQAALSDAIFDLVYNIGPYRPVEVWTSNTGLSHLQYVNRPKRERWRLYSQNRIEHLIGVGGLGLTAGGPGAQEDGTGKTMTKSAESSPPIAS